MIKRKFLGVVMLMLLGAMSLAGGCGSKPGDSGGGTSVRVGVDWTRVTDESNNLLFSPGEDVSITDICAGGPGLVAVGYSKQSGTAGKGGFPITLQIWTSPDGRSWTRLGPDAFVGGALREIQKAYQREGFEGKGTCGPRIVSGPSGLLVTCGLHIFKSFDGLSWAEVKGVTSFDGSSCEMNTATGRFTYTFAPEYFVDVAVSGNGYVASVLSDTTRAGADGWLPCPSIWTSSNGEEWQLAQLEHNEVFGMNDVNALSSAIQGMVAVGRATDEDFEVNMANAGVWEGTADGLSWTRLAGSAASLGGPGAQAMFSVSPGGPGMVAVGMEDIDPTGLQHKRDGVAWYSNGGTVWSRTPAGDAALADAEMLSVTKASSGMMAAGVAYQEEIVPNQPVVRYSSGAVWASTDVLAWARVLLPHVESEPRSGDVARSIVSFTGGLVAVGYEEVGGQSVKGAIWTSLSR